MKFIRLQHIFLGVGLFLLPWLSHAEEGSFAQARAVFTQALHEQDGALERATEKFAHLHDSEPDNPVYLAYLGACKTLEGRDAWMPWNKMRYGEEGLEMIDEALSSLEEQDRQSMPDGVSRRFYTKLIAAQTFLHMPDDIFHRRAKGKRLLQNIMKAPMFSATPKSFRKSVMDAWNER